MADVLDVITLAQGKEALRRSTADTVDDATIAYYITAASRTMDLAVHFGPVVNRAVTDEEIETTNRAGYYKTRVYAARAPVSAWGTVTEYRDGEPTVLTQDTVTTSPASDGYYAHRYQPDTSLYSGRIERRYNGQRGYFQGATLIASYTAGRFTATSAVTSPYRRACELILVNAWRDREPGIQEFGQYQVPVSSFPTFAVPNAAIGHLQSEWRGGAGGTNAS